jgi:hypothetical protein
MFDFKNMKEIEMKKIFALVFLTITCSIASAQNYAGVDGGYGFIDIKAQQTAQTLANLSGSTVTYTYDKAALTGRMFFGFGVADNLALELGYFASANATAKYTISGASATENYSTNGFDAGLVYKPQEDGIFFKAGFHSSKVEGDASVTINGTTYNIASDSKSGTGMMAGVGYEAKMSGSSGLKSRLGWTYYNKVGGVSDANVNLIYFGLVKGF